MQELLFGLVRAMMLQGYNQQFMLVSAGAAEALNAICGQVKSRPQQNLYFSAGSVVQIRGARLIP